MFPILSLLPMDSSLQHNSNDMGPHGGAADESTASGAHVGPPAAYHCQCASPQDPQPGDQYMDRVTLDDPPQQTKYFTTFGQAVCPYCGVGCIVQASVLSNKILSISADEQKQPNFGMLCPKGAYLRKVFVEDARVLEPMIRESRSDSLRRASWEETLALVSRRLRKIRDAHGKDAIAFYGSGQLDTEASYVFVKLFKGFWGTNNMDTNSRLCMASASAAYLRMLGSDGPPTCYADIDVADNVLIVGANMAVNHPVLFKKLVRRRRTSESCRIIVIDPRRTRTAESADLHIPIAAGSDVAFFQLIARRLLDQSACDRKFIERHTDNFDELSHHLHSLDQEQLLEACSVESHLVDQVVALLSDTSSNLLSFYCMGTNQSSRGVDKNESLINLHLMLGQICRPGAGPFSLTGQPNAMGGREVGYLSHQLPGYRFVFNPHHRRYLEEYWRLRQGAIDDTPGLTALPMFQSAAAGQIKALWIAATNPAVSMPDASMAQRALQNCECVIVQDCYRSSETLAFADVILPAAQWGEKTGTMTNSERLVVRSEQFLDPPGMARPDWWIACKVAQSLGFPGFDFSSAEEIWDEYRQLTSGTVCDQSGMSNARLRQGPIHWPCPHENHPGTPRLYADRIFPTPTGKAQFSIVQYKRPEEQVDELYPLVLTTGRVASQWHTRTRSGLVDELNRMDPEPYVELNPLDAERYEVKEGDLVTLIGRRGKSSARARITKNIGVGLVFMPFHWGESFNESTNVNHVTNPAFDPTSKQPELKYCAVRLVRNVEQPGKRGE